MIKCPICGEELEEDAKFCIACGKKIVSECPNCGKNLKPGAKFCSGCGINIYEFALKQESVICPKCSAELDENAQFCSECGFNLGGENPNDDECEVSDYADAPDSSDDYEEYVDEDEYEDDETTEEKITKIVDKYIYDINKSYTAYNSTKLHDSEYSQVLQNLRSNIAKDVSSSEIIGFIDTTVFGKGKAGLVFTTEALYEGAAGASWKVPYWQMGDMNCTGKKLVFSGTEDCGTGWMTKGMDISINNTFYNIPALKDCLDEIYAII